MGQVAELNQNVLWDFDTTDFGTVVDRVLAMAIETKADLNAHTHTGTGVAPGVSVAANNPVAPYASDAPQYDRMKRDLTGLDGRFTQLWTDCVSLLLDAKTKFNAHTHAAIGGGGSTSISLLAPAVVTPYEEEQWNRAHDLFYKTSMGTKMKSLVSVLGEIKGVYNAHTHTPSMTSVPSTLVAAADPSTLTP